MLDGIKITQLEIKNGNVENIGFETDPCGFARFATSILTGARDKVPHLQRPLRRKFDTIIGKLQELQKDLKEHQQYCIDLEQRKQERKEETEFYRQMNKPSTRKALAKFQQMGLFK